MTLIVQAEHPTGLNKAVDLQVPGAVVLGLLEDAVLALKPVDGLGKGFGHVVRLCSTR